MGHRPALVVALVSALLALSCGGGQRSGMPAASSVEAPTTVSIAGPVIVFTDLSGLVTRVIALDTASGAAWMVLEAEDDKARLRIRGGRATDVYGHRTQVRVAGSQLIVSDGAEIRRVALDGSTDAVLWSPPAIGSAGIRDLEVSPDGTKIAVAHDSGPRVATVVNALTGDEILSVDGDDPRFRPYAKWQPDWFGIGNWNTSSDAFAVESYDADDPAYQQWVEWWEDYFGHRAIWSPPQPVAILSTDGAVRVLYAPERLHHWLVGLSPDFRYLIMRGAPWQSHDRPLPYYRGPVRVIEARTGEALRTIHVRGTHYIVAHESLRRSFPGMSETALWAAHPDGYLYFEYWEVDGERTGVTDNLVAWLEGRHPSNLRARLLNLETGESQPLSHAEWMGDVDQRAVNACVGVLPSWACSILLKAHHVQQGRRSVALIELDQPASLPASLFSQPCQLSGAC